MRRYFYFNYTLVLAMMLLFIASCKKEEYKLPVAKDALQNDLIKRSLGPNVVGLNIEFAYAMALPADKGKLSSAEVLASIPGGPGTFLEHRSFYTAGTGADVGVAIGNPSVNDHGKTTVTFTKDTFAATLRYYYEIPEAARGKTVSFTFTAKSSTGETVSYNAGPYTIAKMDIVRNLTLTDGNAAYLSISDGVVYNSANAAANASKIDLIYVYRATPATFAHALVSPVADAQYRPGVTVPPGATNNTKVRKVFNLQDFHLANLQYGIYIDDLDFEKLDLTDAANFTTNLKQDSGVWVETADKKYRAYIFVHSINNGSKTAVISMKRFAL